MKILSINVKKMTRYRGNNHAYLRKKDIGTIKCPFSGQPPGHHGHYVHPSL
jgi:hypothetical protein